MILPIRQLGRFPQLPLKGLLTNSFYLMGASKNSDFFVSARIRHTQSRSVYGIHEGSSTESTQLSWKKCIFISALMSVIFACSYADTLFAEEYFLQPSEVNSTFSNKTSYRFVDTLSNERLAEQVLFMRSTEMTATHRALNHQWLAAHSGQEKQTSGNKILSKIAKKTFKEYWNNRDNEYGSVSLTADDLGELRTNYNHIDYKLRLNKNGVKLKLDYEF